MTLPYTESLAAKEARGLNGIQQDLKAYNSVTPKHLIRMTWNKGDTIYHTDQGHTLERIRDMGSKDSTRDQLQA